MRILHILDHSLPRRTGYALRSQAVIAQQRALGWQTVHLTGPAHGDVQGQEGSAGDWHFFRTEPPSALLARMPLLFQAGCASALASRIRQVVKLTRPHILHAHAPALNGIAALRIGRRCRLPVVYEARDWWLDPGRDGTLAARAARLAENWVLRRADAVAASSEAMLGELRARGARCPAAVIPAAVDPYATCEPSNAAVLRAELGLGDGPTVGYVGPLREEEGVMLLPEAFASVLREFPRARLLIAGSGPLEAALRARAAAPELAGRVAFATGIEAADLAHYYPLADVAVYPRLPSRHAQLFVPFQALEAMAHGCAVAASRTGGHRELVAHRATGLLFEPGSVQALADSVKAMLGDPGLVAAIRNGAQRFVAERHTWEASVARYGPLYQRVLARQPE